MTDQPIAFGKPMLGPEEIDAVTKVLSGSTLVHGPVTHAFEQRFAERVGARHAVSLSSCTAALHMSLYALGIGKGDRVAVPAMTHVATAHAVEFCGAVPEFVDVAADSGNIDCDRLAAVNAPDLRAFLVVHFLGLPCDMDRLRPLAARHGAVIVEDAAIALDATYDDSKAGTLGTVGCFSFYPTKHMTTIEGGMITTNDESLAQAIAQRKAFGYDRTIDQRAKPGIYDVVALGYNYRMNEVQAAVGLAQLAKLDAMQKARAANFATLRDALSDIAEITVFAPRQGKAQSSHFCLNAVLPRDASIDRDAVVAQLKEGGIGTSVHYPRPVPLMSYYREKYGFAAGQFPVAEWLADQTISLPVGPHLGNDDMQRIGRAMKSAVHRARR